MKGYWFEEGYIRTSSAIFDDNIIMDSVCIIIYINLTIVFKIMIFT